MGTWVAWLAPIAAIIGMLVAVYLARWVLAQDPGNEKMNGISMKIQEGAKAFLFSEYKVLAVFLAVVAIIIIVVPSLPWLAAVAFITGGLLSAAAGYVGMYVATRANTRTTRAAFDGIAPALKVAFRSGLTMGLVVASFGLFGISLWIILMIIGVDVNAMASNAEVVNGFAMGASSIALFARVGGGIYTKAADVGADLVGKVEAGIPEDDPRNPAVIADNVGDNVGDVAGMGADLFESYCGSILAPVILAAALAAAGHLTGADLAFALTAPLLIAACGIIASIIGMFCVKTNDEDKLHQALNTGTYVAAVVEVIACFILFLLWQSKGAADFHALWFFGAMVLGLAAGLSIGKITEYFCSDHYKPVKKIAEASTTGTATNIIEGIGTGFMSTIAPILVVAIAILGAYFCGTQVAPGTEFGVYGIGLAALGMLSTTAITVGVDAYGPVADNAGGVAEMSELDPSIRQRTDRLDAVGNTTAAIAKGFAIGSAGLTALSLFVSFRTTLAAGLGSLALSLTDPYVIVGLFIGGMLPFLFAALTMGAVSRAAHKMVEEVRRQFREIPGIMEGTGEPDPGKCVAISTQAALHEMVVPGVIAVAAPIVVGLLNVEMLAGMLAGALVTGFLLAIFMANAGGAWDNAKKYIENGHFGGKHSEAHAAAVCGDTVGDPFKDTSGPSMNILIKLMTVVSLVFAPMFIALGGGILF